MRLTDPYDLFYKITEKSKTGKAILNAMLELTVRCNFRCVHCYNKGLNRNELTLNGWKSIISRLEQAECIEATLTGGEPLLRKDFKDIYLELKRKGFLVNLFTNGILLDDEQIALFKDYPPAFIDISLYGSSAKIYEKITGQKDAFRKVVRNLEKLKKSGLKFELKSMILKENQEDIENIAELARSFGVKFRLDPIIDPCRGCSDNLTDHRVDPAVAARLERLDPQRCNVFDDFFSGKSKLAPNIQNKRFRCVVENVKSFIFIRSDGLAAPCTGLSRWAVNIPEELRIGEYSKIFWENFDRCFWDKPDKILSNCTECKYLGICGICTADEIGRKEISANETDNYLFEINLEREKLSLSLNK